MESSTCCDADQINKQASSCDKLDNMGRAWRTPSPMKEAYISSSVENSPSSASAFESSSSRTGVVNRFARPSTPLRKQRKYLWHGLPSPDTPGFDDVFSKSLLVSSEEGQPRKNRSSPIDNSRGHNQDIRGRGGLEDEAIVSSAAVASSQSILRDDEQLARELNESSSLATTRRSNRMRKQINSYNLLPTAPADSRKVAKVKAKLASSSSITEPSPPFSLTITAANADPIPFDGLPALRSLDWELQYPPGGSTHPSYPYPTLDPLLIFCQPFVPIIDGLPDFSKVPKLVLPMGWRQVTWCGLLPVVFDPYRQAFKLTPVGPLPLTCEELHQGGLQKYVPGGELHPEAGLLPEMMRLSDGSADEVYNWEGVNWTLPWGEHENTGRSTSSPAGTSAFNSGLSLQVTNTPLLAITTPWREARDCPNQILDLEDAWRWLGGKERQPDADFVPRSAKRPRNGAYRTYRKIKSPIPELMIGAILADPDEPNPILQNQDNTLLSNNFCPYKSVATPVNVDITLLAHTEFTLVELLSYFPQHFYWGHAAERLSRAGIQPPMIKNLVNMARALEGETALKSSTVNSAVTTAKKRDVNKGEAVVGSDNILGDTSPASNTPPVPHAQQITADYTAAAWSYDVWDKIDYPLFALTHGLQQLPTGPDAGPLTSLIHWCRINERYRILLSDVPALLEEAEIEPLIELSDDGCPDKDVAPRHHEALKRDFQRVKRSLDTLKRAAEDEQDGGRKKGKLSEIIG